MNEYDPKQIESKWQQIWEESGLHTAKDFDDKPKYYCLFEFNYPSGDGLHVGHVRAFTAVDIIARFRRMLGFNVLFPIGWDAFGLPTENYAIKHKIQPRVATDRNIANFRRQNRALGYSVDWSREIDTTDPAYYRWTQWIFLKLLAAGLAYQAEIPINWCPFEKIGLANEEVVNGKHERCGTAVTKKNVKQWILKITAYADRLIEDLAEVDYPEQVKAQQINWIGRSGGAEVDFKVDGRDELIKVFTTRPDTLFGATYVVLAPEHELVSKITTNAQEVAVEEYVAATKHKSELDRQIENKSKTGVFTGAYAINPGSGERIPIWIADYVLTSYGTGAIMAVPAHDERDGEFAQQFDLPIVQVVAPMLISTTGSSAVREDEFERREMVTAIVKHWSEDKYICLDWKGFDWHTFVVGGTDGEDPIAAAEREVHEETGYKNMKYVKTLGGKVHSKFFAEHKNVNRWAEFTGVLFELLGPEKEELSPEESAKHEVVWIDRANVESYLGSFQEDQTIFWNRLKGENAYTGEGVLTNSGEFDGLDSAAAREKIVAWLVEKGLGKEKVNYKLRDWIFSRQHYWGEPIPVIHCPTDGVVPVPEKDLPVKLPEVEHYEPTETGESPLSTITEWVEVACPKCGQPARRETDTMPNWAGSSWYYLRYIDPGNDQEFASRKKLDYWLPVDLYEGGMEHTTLHLLYSRFWHKFLFDEGLVPGSEPYARRRSHGIVLATDGRKMSKSFGNVVNPDDVIMDYGADALRTYEMFMGPFDQEIAWDPSAIAGVYRFLTRAHRFGAMVAELPAADRTGEPDSEADIRLTALERVKHRTVKRVSESIDELRFNVAVAGLMEYLNALTAAEDLVTHYGEQLREYTEVFLLLLSPFAPHLAEELWSQFGRRESIFTEGWPSFDPEMLTDELLTVPVQVNGHLRGTIVVDKDTDATTAIAAAKANPAIAKYLTDKTTERELYVPGKIVTIVTKDK